MKKRSVSEWLGGVRLLIEDHIFGENRSMSKLEELADGMAAHVKNIVAANDIEQGLLAQREKELRLAEAALQEREAALLKRELAAEDISKQLSLARVAKKAAEDREAALSEKLREARAQLGAKTVQLSAIEKAFPHLVAPAPAAVH